MQRNQYFKVKIFSIFIVISPLVFWALTNLTPASENNESEAEREQNAKNLEHIDMLCRGKFPLPDNIQKELKCRYTDHGNPFLKLVPFKEEEAYLEPRIVIFHDVISNEEIEIVKKLTQPKIKLDEVKADEDWLQSGRIGQVAWLKKDKHEIVEVFYRRVEHMTRLSVATAEALQVCCYRIGGMFLQHFDFLHFHSVISQEGEEVLVKDGYGDRVATLMYYSNNVEEGGRTVFPELNISLTPKKGSAVFWYNLTPNGIPDPLTLHAGCPVISGTKWVANVWFHENGQEFLRPCTLENQPAVDWESE